MTTGSTPVVTVTVNPALDLTVWIPGFTAGAVNRVDHEATRAGGKGVNVAARLAELGIAVSATGVLGADNARPFETLLADRGIVDRFVRRPGATRTGIKIVDPEHNRTTDVNFPGAPVPAAVLAALEDAVSELAASAAWVVLAGSLPPDAPVDLYRRLTEVAHERGAAVAVDTSGPALAAALGAAPDLVKPNEHELAELVGRPIAGRDDLLAATLELRGAGVGTVVVSLGAEGALFCGEAGVFVASALAVDVVSTVGAGDAMVAGAVAGLLGQRTLAEVAGLATACSAVAISGVDARLDASDVESRARKVEIEIVTSNKGEA